MFVKHASEIVYNFVLVFGNGKTVAAFDIYTKINSNSMLFVLFGECIAQGRSKGSITI